LPRCAREHQRTQLSSSGAESEGAEVDPEIIEIDWISDKKILE
jgi:hypothetical protein